MKWYSYLICAICIISGIFCSVNLFKIWSEKSAIFGDITSVETHNNYEELAKFDFGVINFEADDEYQNFTYQEKFKHYDFDGDNHGYAVLFNDNLISNVQFKSGEIVATYCMKFYGLSGELLTTVNMNILIDFYDNETQVSLSMKNDNGAVAYFNRYMTVNGAILKVEQKGGAA